jgi:predicted transcriptional regulator of viral defense system
VKHIRRVREYLRRTPVADFRSISLLLPDRGYASVLMNHLLRRGEVRRISRGYYTVHSDPSLLVYCLKPAYLGLQDALSFHNLWEQETVPVILTTRRVRVGVREVLGQNVWVRRISPRYFFGYEYLRSGELLLPVSDLEKTLIDLVYFGEMREELAGEFRRRVNREKLERYLRRYEPPFRERVLGLLE